MSELRCELCFHHCSLGNGQTGLCRARGNVDGEIRSLNYGRISALALDPIEKKPLRRFYPGSLILSVGSFGCNLCCPFCQNHEISMAGVQLQTMDVHPEQLVEKAAELRALGNIGLAYTYNEPLVGYEFVRDCARMLHFRGMVNVLVSNGTIEEGPWRELLPLIDAANIDLKGFRPEWYRRLGGDLDTVKRSIMLAAEAGCHLEVSTLLIPGENDSVEEIRKLCHWLAELSPNIPLHLSRFFPRYTVKDKAPTPPETV
ncbi:MAG: AmmeMemoRadiSam system radical SAM enzyme, partial [Bacillota bacterium]|nr:AmmeMemoRadiSam system radical SAM enzyme [Bacillota bacterium]